MQSSRPLKPTGPAEPLPAGSTYEDRRAAFLEAEVGRALTMWKGLLPPDVIEAFRERTAVFLMTDPAMIRAVDAALPRTEAEQAELQALGVEQSKVVVTGAEEEAQPEGAPGEGTEEGES